MSQPESLGATLEATARALAQLRLDGTEGDFAAILDREPGLVPSYASLGPAGDAGLAALSTTDPVTGVDETLTLPPVEQDAELPIEQQAVEPLSEQQDAEPPLEQQDAEPPPVEQDAELPIEQQDAEPPLEEQDAEPVLEQQDAEPPLEQQDAEPPLEQQGAEPVLEQQDAEPLLEQQDAEPLLECTSCGRQESESLTESPCGHGYCEQCLLALLDMAMVNESLFPPRCCKVDIPLDLMSSFLTEEKIQKFQEKTLEFGTPNRTYCHDLKCSAFIPPALLSGRTATCAKCRKRTCVLCKRAKHDKKCRPDTATRDVVRLAQRKGWQRCFSCGRVVELDRGCNHMTKLVRICAPLATLQSRLQLLTEMLVRRPSIRKSSCNANPSHEGSFIRTPIDEFKLQGPKGSHYCLVYGLMRESLDQFRQRFEHHKLPVPLFKLHVFVLLEALDYLHSECRLIHTDIKDDNIMMTFEENFHRGDVIDSLTGEPVVQRVGITGRVMNSSYNFGPLRGFSQLPKLADFDRAFPGWEMVEAIFSPIQ
ncbi:Protein kinase-like domain protein [Metarhizium rileyi]|uniref:Protein kinase-like domain protein n=1 Tax=Metarhizium rileyi (strain RCEF 4871) TaxID=1649241 RepID=A0A166ZFL1_METRR|nr:Protein kinase-like domain protein [Metarhizium rileyi RCEF 4871]